MSKSSKKKLGDLEFCLQCAICTGSCPSARVFDGYNPREIILRRLLYGEEETLLDSELIWCCTTCHTCEERCPHGISVGKLLIEVMNRAAKRGKLPEAIRQTIATIAETGRAVPSSMRTERLRAELGLKPLRKCDVDEIRKLLHKCGIDTKQERKCE